MAVAIAFRFLAGRFHATPWDRHPNEGVPEWPPAPWRILRALVASAYRADGDPDALLLAKVVGALSNTPTYRVPAATAGHLRSYQPKYGRTDNPSLVFDAFVVVGKGAGDENAICVAEWEQATLDIEAEQALDRWLDAMGYLGRAESWVEAFRIAQVDDTPAVVPIADTDRAPSRTRLLTPAPANSPEDAAALLASLMTDTEVLYASRITDPPNAYWQSYQFMRSPFATPPLRPRLTATVRAPTLVSLLLAGTVLPLLTDVVRLGDRVRAALMSRSKGADGLPHPVFSGKSEDGVPLHGNSHAHVLPFDGDQDGRLEGIVLWAPGGFDGRALKAIAEFTWLWGDDGYDLRVVFAGEGAQGDALATFGIARQDEAACTLARSTHWQSRTPFVLPRHPKTRRGRLVDGPEEQLRRECNRAGFPPLVSARPVAGTKSHTFLSWHRFRLQRTSGGGSRGSERGFGFALEFAEPVYGPIAVGYGARQGLGQFAPIHRGVYP